MEVCGFYLPQQKYATKTYLKEILLGTVFSIKSYDVRLINTLNPPVKEKIVTELRQALKYLNLLPIGKISKTNCPEKDWLLGVLGTIDPNN